jgi:hypothetical protein
MMNDDTLGIAPGRRALLIPAVVAFAALATLMLALIGRSWVNSRTTAVISKGAVRVLNGGFDHDSFGWAPVGPAALQWSPGHGGSLAITSSSAAAQAGAAAPEAILIIGRVDDGAVYRIRAQLRLAQPGVRNVRLAVIGCIGGASDAARSPDLTPRLSTNTWTTVTFDVRLLVASCPAMVPTIQVSAIGRGHTLSLDDVSLAPR